MISCLRYESFKLAESPATGINHSTAQAVVTPLLATFFIFAFPEHFQSISRAFPEHFQSSFNDLQQPHPS